MPSIEVIGSIVGAVLIYLIPGMALRRIFRRTGHGFGWQLACLGPAALVMLVVVTPWIGAPVSMVSVVGPAAMLVLIGLFFVLAQKRWPLEPVPTDLAKRFE